MAGHGREGAKRLSAFGHLLFSAAGATFAGKHKNMNCQEENYRDGNCFVQPKHDRDFFQDQSKQPREKDLLTKVK